MNPLSFAILRVYAAAALVRGVATFRPSTEWDAGGGAAAAVRAARAATLSALRARLDAAQSEDAVLRAVADAAGALAPGARAVAAGAFSPSSLSTASATASPLRSGALVRTAAALRSPAAAAALRAALVSRPSECSPAGPAFAAALAGVATAAGQQSRTLSPSHDGFLLLDSTHRDRGDVVGFGADDGEEEERDDGGEGTRRFADWRAGIDAGEALTRAITASIWATNTGGLGGGFGGGGSGGGGGGGGGSGDGSGVCSPSLNTAPSSGLRRGGRAPSAASVLGYVVLLFPPPSTADGGAVVDVGALRDACCSAGSTLAALRARSAHAAALAAALYAAGGPAPAGAGSSGAPSLSSAASFSPAGSACGDPAAEDVAALARLDATAAADAAVLAGWDVDGDSLPRGEARRLLAAMVHSLGLFTTFRIAPSAFAAFVDEVEAAYRPNPFHNVNQLRPRPLSSSSSSLFVLLFSALLHAAARATPFVSVTCPPSFSTLMYHLHIHLFLTQCVQRVECDPRGVPAAHPRVAAPVQPADRPGRARPADVGAVPRCGPRGTHQRL